mmetsp:Transcript_4628/g.7702  ORF Transcript_4628/g.7702 Transcript_4628/m.7702 type:complete len:221 (+) Transcript_4628:746-1408(+)
MVGPGGLPRPLHDGLRLRDRRHEGSLRRGRRPCRRDPDLCLPLRPHQGLVGRVARARAQLRGGDRDGAARGPWRLQQGGHDWRARGGPRLARVHPAQAQADGARLGQAVLQADLEPLLFRVPHVPLHLSKAAPRNPSSERRSHTRRDLLAPMLCPRTARPSPAESSRRGLLGLARWRSHRAPHSTTAVLAGRGVRDRGAGGQGLSPLLPAEYCTCQTPGE